MKGEQVKELQLRQAQPEVSCHALVGHDLSDEVNLLSAQKWATTSSRHTIATVPGAAITRYTDDMSSYAYQAVDSAARQMKQINADRLQRRRVPCGGGV